MKIIIILSLVWAITGCAGVKGLSNLIIENSKRIGEAKTELVNAKTDAATNNFALADGDQLQLEPLGDSGSANTDNISSGDIALVADESAGANAPVSNSGRSVNGQVVSSTYYNAFTHKDLGDYAWQTLVQLRTQLPAYISRSPILVTDFVEYDLSMHNINNVAHHLSAHLQAKAGPLGFRLINPAVTKTMQNLKTGHHVFDVAQYENFAEYRWVLTGTLVQLGQGMKLMAQIVDTKNQQVYATTDVLLPQFIIDQLAQRKTIPDTSSDD